MEDERRREIGLFRYALIREADQTKNVIDGRRTKVAAMMLARRTEREIAQALGIGLATVNRDMQAVRAEWARRRRASGDAWGAERIADLDAFRRAYMPAALNGDLRAAEFLLKVGA